MNIPVTDWNTRPIKGVNIETDSLLVAEGASYSFKNLKGYSRVFYQEGEIFRKLDDDFGGLFIKKFDQTNRIISGTFSFDATSTSGQKVSITDGRFDLRY